MEDKNMDIILDALKNLEDEELPLGLHMDIMRAVKGHKRKSFILRAVKPLGGVCAAALLVLVVYFSFENSNLNNSYNANFEPASFTEWGAGIDVADAEIATAPAAPQLRQIEPLAEAEAEAAGWASDEGRPHFGYFIEVTDIGTIIREIEALPGEILFINANALYTHISFSFDIDDLNFIAAAFDEMGGVPSSPLLEVINGDVFWAFEEWSIIITLSEIY